jgi:integrase
MTKPMKEKLKKYLRNHKHELLFVNKAGNPMEGNKIVRFKLHPILEKLGIPRKGRRVGLHAFRHSLASILLQTTGAAVAQRQLRHSDAHTTLQIYGHVLGDDHMDAMERVQSVLSGTPAEIVVGK